MTDPATAEEMREAAAQEAEALAANPTPTLWNYGTVSTALDRAEWKGRKEAAEDVAAMIRAIPIPIAPPPDREGLVELAEGSIVGQPSPIDAARAVIAALEAAGALADPAQTAEVARLTAALATEQAEHTRTSQAASDEVLAAQLRAGRALKAQKEAEAREVKLREALEKIAAQHLGEEMDEPDDADWEGGFEALVEIARAALQGGGE